MKKRSITSTVELRSAIMRAVKGRDTGPERIVRRLAHSISPGYRLHRRDIPGNPDIAYVGRKLAIFVHGCFWHGHRCPRGARRPKTNVTYWEEKIERNRRRDRTVIRRLRRAGWRVLIVWECELRKREVLKAKITRFIGQTDGDPVLQLSSAAF